MAPFFIWAGQPCPYIISGVAPNSFVCSVVIEKKLNNNGTDCFLHHLWLCGKHWNDTRLSATGNHNHTHTQHRRHLRAGVPYDGNRRLCLYAAGIATPPKYHLVNVHHQCRHLHMQLHNLCNKNYERLF